MARRGFFGYDPYDCYYPASPYAYDYDPYYHSPAVDAFFAEPLVTARRRAPTQHDDGFFPGFRVSEPAARTRARPRPSSGSPKSCPDCYEVEVTGPEPDSPPAVPRKPAPSAEEAAARVQAAARGLLARRMVREVRAVERQAEAVAARVAAEAEALRADARARIGLGEELMRLLLRLDGVRGAREYRRRVTRRVLALHDAVDALEATPTMVAADVPEVQDAEEEAESGMEPELSVEDNTASDFLAAETTDMAAMEVDATSPVVVDEAGQNETELVAESEKASEAEGEWEMVATGDGDVSTGEEDPAPPKAQQQQQQEQAHEEKKTVTTDGLDANKLMEMVTALCERSAQQCALIGALAERVDTLERAVRRVEEADRRRRRNKKTNKDGKKNTSSFYND
ncbi:hypothetical protein VPH35_107294 [Triticum aestivum]